MRRIIFGLCSALCAVMLSCSGALDTENNLTAYRDTPVVMIIDGSSDGMFAQFYQNAYTASEDRLFCASIADSDSTDGIVVAPKNRGKEQILLIALRRQRSPIPKEIVEAMQVSGEGNILDVISTDSVMYFYRNGPYGNDIKKLKKQILEVNSASPVAASFETIFYEPR
jgi:hypothetical protein